MKVQALLNAAFIKPMVLNDDGKGTHDPPAPTEGGNISIRRQPAGGGGRQHGGRVLSAVNNSVTRTISSWLIAAAESVEKKTKCFRSDLGEAESVIQTQVNHRCKGSTLT